LIVVVVVVVVVVKDAFNANAKDGSAPVSSLDNIMTKLGYKFAPQTMKLLQAFVDREKKGSFTFEKLAYLLAFIQFTLNHFNEADTDQSKTLEYNEVKENLKWLGLDKASDAEVQALFKKYDLDGNNHLEFEV
jgi:Ca2+-binding EF-hand superfamily protein